jgi:hypothetical protein
MSDLISKFNSCGYDLLDLDSLVYLSVIPDPAPTPNCADHCSTCAVSCSTCGAGCSNGKT